MRNAVTKVTALGVAVAALLTSMMTTAVARQPYLSNFHATKDSPLYTTYAAALQRSEFTLDLGYHMVFYDSSRGIEFQNQKAGDWGIAFADGSGGMESRYRWKFPSLFRPPVITVSYSDIVKYYYNPFRDIRVDVTFLVYSSQTAVQEFVLKNLVA